MTREEEQKNKKLQELQPIAARECERQMEAFRAMDITDVKIGKEMEFGFTGIADAQALAALHKKAEAFLLKQKEGKTEAEQQKIDRKIARVKQFNAGEMVMFDLIEMDDDTRPHLQHLFGRHPTHGYYDESGVFELKTKPISIPEFFTQEKTIRAALRQKAKPLGLTVKEVYSHLSFSFWKEGECGPENLNSNKHPEYMERTGQLIEGITRAFYDASGLLQGNFADLGEMGINIGCGVSRHGLLRIANNRIELRIAMENVPDEVSASIILAGALSRLKHPEPNPAIIPYEKGRKINLGNKDLNHTSGIIKHLLGNSLLDEEGKMHTDKLYLFGNAVNIFKILIGDKTNPSDDYPLAVSKAATKLVNCIISSFCFAEAPPDNAAKLHSSSNKREAKRRFGAAYNKLAMELGISPEPEDDNPLKERMEGRLLDMVNSGFGIESVTDIPFVPDKYMTLELGDIIAQKKPEPQVRTERFARSRTLQDGLSPETYAAYERYHETVFGRPGFVAQTYVDKMEAYVAARFRGITPADLL